MDQPNERPEIWRQILGRLDAAYSVSGHAALAKMNGIEVLALYNEKIYEINRANERLAEFPHDEPSKRWKETAVRAANDIAGFIKEKQRREREDERDRGR